MTDSNTHALPAYAAQDVKAALLDAGVSGTIYSLVMPESESALSYVVDGGDNNAGTDVAGLRAARSRQYFSRYHEPWSQKQDAMHESYFDTWLRWSAPVVTFPADDFPYRYPTAGASEGIFKLMAEYAANCRVSGSEPVIHIFDGEYEGFPAYAEALNIRTVRHNRREWQNVPQAVDPEALFWISQPSAIDGMVWPHFEDFVRLMQTVQPQASVMPDLTYVGSVARAYHLDLSSPNIPAIVISHSKPFGGYYHRVGGVLARRDYPSLFGNKWFKNLLSLAWGTEMMMRYGVFDLPRKYRLVQEKAVQRVAAALHIDAFTPADVLLLGIARPERNISPLLKHVLRGSATEQVIRLCLTPTMTCLIDPAMAPTMMARLAGQR